MKEREKAKKAAHSLLSEQKKRAPATPSPPPPLPLLSLFSRTGIGTRSTGAAFSLQGTSLHLAPATPDPRAPSSAPATLGAKRVLEVLLLPLKAKAQGMTPRERSGARSACGCLGENVFFFEFLSFFF